MNRLHRRIVWLALPLVALPLTTRAYDLFPEGDYGIGGGAGWYDSPYVGVGSEWAPQPDFSYEGERVSLSFGEISYALIQSDMLEFGINASVRSADFEPDDSTALSGMLERDEALDLGLGLVTPALGIPVFMEFSGDVSGEYSGQEVTLGTGIPIGDNGSWGITAFTGANWQSKQLVNYNYGVSSTEAHAGRPQYSGDSAVNWVAGLDAHYEFAKNWILVGNVHYVQLAGEISDSPIVEKDDVPGAGLGLMLRF